jgi:hypothetical protein
MKNHKKCKNCGKYLKEGQYVYAWVEIEFPFFFCSKDCFRSWTDEGVFSGIYHTEDLGWSVFNEKSNN